MRRLGFGILLGVAVAFFARWRGGFSRAVEAVEDRLPEPDDRPEPPAAEPLAGDPEDATLVDRVKSEVLHDERFKGRVNVAAEFGRVVLHGELEGPELVEELVAAVRGVEGVRDVDCRLNTPGVPVELPKRPRT